MDSHDNAYFEALKAFNDAVTAYHPDECSFYALAAAAIRNRVTDLLRKENRCKNTIPFSRLAAQDEDGQEKPFEAIDTAPVISDTALEIEALRQELQGRYFLFQPSQYLSKVSADQSCVQRACLLVT